MKTDVIIADLTEESFEDILSTDTAKFELIFAELVERFWKGEKIPFTPNTLYELHDLLLMSELAKNALAPDSDNNRLNEIWTEYNSEEWFITFLYCKSAHLSPNFATRYKMCMDQAGIDDIINMVYVRDLPKDPAMRRKTMDLIHSRYAEIKEENDSPVLVLDIVEASLDAPSGFEMPKYLEIINAVASKYDLHLVYVLETLLSFIENIDASDADDPGKQVENAELRNKALEIMQTQIVNYSNRPKDTDFEFYDAMEDCVLAAKGVYAFLILRWFATNPNNPINLQRVGEFHNYICENIVDLSAETKLRLIADNSLAMFQELKELTTGNFSSFIYRPEKIVEYFGYLDDKGGDIEPLYRKLL